MKYDKKTYKSYIIPNYIVNKRQTGKYKTYEEALEKGLQEALNLLP